MGEAANPGPGLDDSDGDFGGSEDSWEPLPGSGQWQPPWEEEHDEFDEPWIATSASSRTAAALSKAAVAAAATEEQKWLRKHAGVAFVPVGSKKVTKKSKFLG